MEATGRVIKRKGLTLETKQRVHRCLKKNWKNGQNLEKMPVYRMVVEIFAISEGENFWVGDTNTDKPDRVCS
ncbi:unnamed protein product [Tenebrio molitor]|nr:unnamed protein product [Tenebrio molitor]